MLSFFTFTEANITTMLGYISDVVADITPILLPIIAVFVGLIIFQVIVNSIKK